MVEYTTKQMTELIEQYIHNIDDRKMLLMRLIDGISFEKIGFAMELTTKTVRRRIHKGEEILFRHIQK